MALPAVASDADKNERGCALVIGGSCGLSGAVLLAAVACVRAGAGKLKVGAPSVLQESLSVAIPEAYVAALPCDRSGALRASGALRSLKGDLSRADAVLVGPGMTGAASTVAFVRGLMRVVRDQVVVLDAEALKYATADLTLPPSLRGRVIVTPHAGEMATMLGVEREVVLKRPDALAAEFATKTGFVTVLKGATTYIADPDGELYVDESGNAGLATSGSGDVLAGLVCGLAARGCSPVQASLWAVHVHGLAGEKLAKDIGPLGYLARELLPEIPRLLA